MAIPNEFTLDISRQTEFAQFFIPQGDNIDRYFYINLINGDESYVIPSTASVRFSMTKSNGKVIYNNCTVTDNKIYLKITPAISAEAGRHPAQFRITDSATGGLLKSFRFHVLFDESVDIEEVIVNTSEFTALQDMELRVGDVTNVITNAETATSDAITATNTINQTNTNVQNAETTRVSNENIRISSETTRINNENERIISENTRESQENTRISSENTRISDETKRKNNEITRESNESIRQDFYNAYKVCEIYDNTKSYIVGNKVTYNGSTYQCILNCTGIQPTNTTNWMLIASKGADGTGGNMMTNIYDTTGKNTDIFEYVDTKTTTKVSKGELVINVKDYGAVGDGIADDTTKIQAAIDAAINLGVGIVYLPKGKYLILSTLNINGVVTLMGAGRWVTQIVTDSPNLNMISVSIVQEVSGMVIQDLMVYNRTNDAKTSGVGVTLAGFSANFTRCVFAGSYIGADFINASQWTLNDCYFANHVMYGVKNANVLAPDTGDQVITGCLFNSASAEAAIRLESGGGLKISATKILAHKYGFDLQVADDVATSVLTMTGCSIEGQTLACARLGRKGTTGTYSCISITGNEFACPVAGIIVENGAQAVNIGNNVYVGGGVGTAVVINGGETVVVNGENVTTCAKGIKVAGGTDVDIKNNHYLNTPILIENTTDARNNINVESDKNIGNVSITSDTTYTNLFKIDLSTYSSGSIELFFRGIVQGAGEFVRKAEILINRGATTCTVTNVYDIKAGITIDVQFDINTTIGSVIIGVKRNTAAGGSQLDGVVEYKTKGHIQIVTALL